MKIQNLDKEFTEVWKEIECEYPWIKNTHIKSPSISPPEKRICGLCGEIIEMNIPTYIGSGLWCSIRVLIVNTYF